jgi:hypothetical protein
VSSPYERALDLDGLDPALRTYFSGVPSGSVGVGVGVFAVVGTPRRWIWPLLSLLRRDGILSPGWQKEVPFTVHNRPQPDGSLVAERRFGLSGAPFTMVDHMTVAGGMLTDVLGRSARLSAEFNGSVEFGTLVLSSRSVSLRVGGRWMRVPRPLAPRVSLTESRDRDDARQHVSVSLALPIIGKIYEYSGSFTYRIEGETT